MMKSYGVVRRVDELGRIVIPKELRRTMGISELDPMEIYVANDAIVLTKFKPSCMFCGKQEETAIFKDKVFCNNCIAELTKLVKY